MITEYINDIKREFNGYGKAGLSKDLMAGLTVAAVALPLALAFGVSSGATAASGLITAIIAGLLIGALSGASFQISGPTGAMTAILILLVSKHGLNGMFIATFLAGLMLILAGVLKLGRIISYIPSSVITGFTSGIAVIIALGQLDNLFGVSSKGDHALVKLMSYATDGFHPHLPTLAIGLFVIAVMALWPARWNATFPSSLASLILVLILNRFMQLDTPLVGAIPKTLFLADRLTFASLSPGDFGTFMMPALSIAALAMIESLLCGAAAGKMKNEVLSADRELVAQGIGNVVIPFFGGVPATAAIARTSVVIKSGGVTRLAGIIHSVVLLLSMFLLAPVMSAIPLSALSGVLIVTAWRMNDWENIRFIFGHRFKSGIAKFAVTLCATVVLDLTQAIVAGVLFSTVLFVARLTDLDVDIREVDRKRLEAIGIHLTDDPCHIRVAYLTGTIFFASVDKLKAQLSDLDRASVLILSMRGVPVIDLSGIQALNELIRELQQSGTTVLLTSVQPKVMANLIRGGIRELIDERCVFSSAEHAIVYAHEQHPDCIEPEAAI